MLVGLVIAAAIYTLVHVWSFNLMLIAAAGLCGAFWGLLFAVTGNVWPCIISHAVWDVVIFILLPIQ
jgi:membrane protease YdiL (CAAX protease family)